MRDVRRAYGEGRAASTAPDQFRHQDGVAGVLGQGRPYRGLVVTHELGTGKSLTAVRVAQANPGRRVWVVTKAALSGRANLREAAALLDGGDEEFDRAYRAAATKPGFVRELLKQRGGEWIGHSGLEGAGVAPDEVRRWRIERLRRDFRFVHYNGNSSMLRDVLLNDWDSGPRVPGRRPPAAPVDLAALLGQALNRADGRANPFDGCVVVVDEAHNVAGGVINAVTKAEAGGFTTDVPGNFAAIYALLTHARDCKVVLLTATPIVNRTAAAALLVNMAGGHAHVRRGAPGRRRPRGRTVRARSWPGCARRGAGCTAASSRRRARGSPSPTTTAKGRAAWCTWRRPGRASGR